MAQKTKYKVSNSPKRSKATSSGKSMQRASVPNIGDETLPSFPTRPGMTAGEASVATTMGIPTPREAQTSTVVTSDVGTTLIGRTGADLGPASEPDYTYNWPYDFFSLIELVRLDTSIEYDTE